MGRRKKKKYIVSGVMMAKDPPPLLFPHSYISLSPSKFDKKSLGYTKFHKRENDRKGQYTHFWGIAKKLKIKSQERKNVVFCKLLLKRTQVVLVWVLWLQFYFVCIFSRELRQILSTLLVILSIMKLFVANISITNIYIFFFFWKVWEVIHISPPFMNQSS